MGIAMLTLTKPGKQVCPECSPTRKNKRDRCLSVTREGNGFLYFCHHCGLKGATDAARQTPAMDRRAGIDPALAEKFGISTTKDGDGFWLTVPYLERGEVVNHKYRLTSEKRHRMDGGAPLLLWNADCLTHPEVLAGAPVVITEGEWDALAAMTAGLKHVVSVPNGAPTNVTDRPEEAKRYDWVWRHLDALNKVKTFIIATDGDGRRAQPSKGFDRACSVPIAAGS
jgi:hypothetical protein